MDLFMKPSGVEFNLTESLTFNGVPDTKYAKMCGDIQITPTNFETFDLSVEIFLKHWLGCRGVIFMSIHFSPKWDSAFGTQEPIQSFGDNP